MGRDREAFEEARDGPTTSRRGTGSLARVPDGGRDVDFMTHCAAGALERRGYGTVRAVKILSR